MSDEREKKESTAEEKFFARMEEEMRAAKKNDNPFAETKRLIKFANSLPKRFREAFATRLCEKAEGVDTDSQYTESFDKLLEALAVVMNFQEEYWRRRKKAH